MNEPRESVFRIRRLGGNAPDGWYYDCFVSPDGLVEGEGRHVLGTYFVSVKLNLGKGFYLALSEGLEQLRDEQKSKGPVFAFRRTHEPQNSVRFFSPGSGDGATPGDRVALILEPILDHIKHGGNWPGKQG